MISRNIIEELAAEELVDANTKHDPKFNSPHEAYAVIKEELEEMQEDMRRFERAFGFFWDDVRNDAPVMDNLKVMKNFAICAAQEAIQVVAMCDKALKLY